MPSPPRPARADLMPPSLATRTFGPSNLGASAGHRNMLQLIQLRWAAALGQLVTIGVVHLGLGINLPTHRMLAVLGCLMAFNIASQLRWRRSSLVTNRELFVALLVDVASLTIQLYLSGGTSNPFVFLYLLQIILGAVLLEAWSTWSIVAVTTTCLAGLTLWSRPLQIPLDMERGLSSLYVQGLLICFVLNATLLVTLISRISSNLRSRDARLARLRQRAAEEEHIVRMGLLASGAAHELGTPLATLAVILGDWRRMPGFASDAELSQEIEEMQTQVQRCKTILTGILLSAGEARGESSVKTTLGSFLDDLVTDWRRTRTVASMDYERQIDPDLPVVSDSALRQMIGNVLDNALEASPHWLQFKAHRNAHTLTLTVNDAGPGFDPAMLSQLGKPYQSSKGRPGGGLGLFLVVNVARTLGGTVTAHNSPHGGATVVLTLPLVAIAL